MRHIKAIRTGLVTGSMTAAVALGALTSVPAAASGVGSDNTMFKRHFWRGQAFHGEGYHPRVSDIGRERAEAGGRGATDRTAID